MCSLFDPLWRYWIESVHKKSIKNGQLILVFYQRYLLNMIALLITLTGNVLQVRQDVALRKDRLNNFVVSKEFAAL